MTTDDDARASAAVEVDRWETAFTDELLRLFDRQEAVVLARLQGTKARKHTRHWEPPSDRPFEVKSIIDPERWIIDAQGQFRPLVRRVFTAVGRRIAAQARAAIDGTEEDDPGPLHDSLIEAAVEDRMVRVAQGIRVALAEVEAYIDEQEAAGAALPDIVAGVKALYAKRRETWAERIAVVSAVGSINHAALLTAEHHGATAKKWLSRRDERVRVTHIKADGQVRGLNELFQLGGSPPALLMFPGDPAPSVPGREVFGCRCTLLFQFPRRSLLRRLTGKSDAVLEVKDKVRTPEGAAHYGQPIGSTIHRDRLFTVPSGGGGGSTGDVASSTGGRPGGGGSQATLFSTPPKKDPLAGLDVLSGDQDPVVRALVARHSPVAASAGTNILAAVDSDDRLVAFVAWTSDGTVLTVSVQPSLRGRGIGDALVAAAKHRDPAVKPPAPRPAPPEYRPPPKKVRPLDDDGLPVIEDFTDEGDQAGPSGDFDADADRIGRLQKAYLADKADTTTLFRTKGRWTKEREAEQQKIIDHFLNQPGVRRDRKILVLGGFPGSGKTTSINSPAGQAALGIRLEEYVTVNADEVKELMIANGMIPRYPGLTDNEAATMYHAESFEIAHALMRQAARGGYNFAYDTTLKTPSQLGFATDAGGRAAPPPFEVTMLFVDSPIETAKDRARTRYLTGGRYTPLALIDGMQSSRGTSRPRENFDALRHRVNRWVLMDNAGQVPVVVDQGEGNPNRYREEEEDRRGNTLGF